MRPILAAATIVLLTSCASTPAATPFPPGTRAVFPGEHAQELVHQCSRVSPGPVEDTWTPDDAQLDALEAKLPALFKRELGKILPGERARPEDYYRQYGGLVIRGKRVIYVNGFYKGLLNDDGPHVDPVDDGLPHSPAVMERLRLARIHHTWADSAMRVCDSGAIVFGVEYDPETGAFANFAFNLVI
jgi:hypothetical protein